MEERNTTRVSVVKRRVEVTGEEYYVLMTKKFHPQCGSHGDWWEVYETFLGFSGLAPDELDDVLGGNVPEY